MHLLDNPGKHFKCLLCFGMNMNGLRVPLLSHASVYVGRCEASWRCDTSATQTLPTSWINMRTTLFSQTPEVRRGTDQMKMGADYHGIGPPKSFNEVDVLEDE